jgi:hypothetical protein
MASPEPPFKPQGGRAMLMLLLLLLVIGALVAWAFLRNPPGTPDPTTSAAPSAPPTGEPR